VALNIDTVAGGRRWYLARTRLQGGHTVLNFDMPLADVATVMPVPNPEVKLPFNRRVDLAHAKSFAEYIQQEHWMCPGLMTWCYPHDVHYEACPEYENLAKVWLPDYPREDIHLWDGQHRDLGFILAYGDLQTLRQDLERQLAELKEPDGLLATTLYAKLGQVQHAIERMKREAISIDMALIEDPRQATQFFADVANNAKGITASVRIGFDRRDILNRTFERLQHPLLSGRVDLENDRVQGKNANFVSARNVVDVIRILERGAKGRMSAEIGQGLSEQHMAEQTERFFDTLCYAFDDLEALRDGELTAPQLRDRSLLGSAAFLRCLAGAYHSLHRGDDMLGPVSGEQIGNYFHRLEPFMTAPIPDGSPWLSETPSAFPTAGMSSPESRRQNLEEVTEALARWYRRPPAWLDTGEEADAA
jgi:hypothetical protein